jgi:hypothetical protein
MDERGPASFLAGTGRDHAGRTIAQVLAFDDSALEMHHDYIQWLFPLEEPSRAVSGSPVLTRNDIQCIRNDERAAANLRAAAERMGAFYDSTSHWLREFDHNHLRITRIIKSLRILLGDEDADAFRERILTRIRRADARINAETERYWKEA